MELTQHNSPILELKEGIFLASSTTFGWFRVIGIAVAPRRFLRFAFLSLILCLRGKYVVFGFDCIVGGNDDMGFAEFCGNYISLNEWI